MHPAQHSTVDDASRLVRCPRRLLCFINRLILEKTSQLVCCFTPRTEAERLVGAGEGSVLVEGSLSVL